MTVHIVGKVVVIEIKLAGVFLKCSYCGGNGKVKYSLKLEMSSNGFVSWACCTCSVKEPVFA